MKKKLAMIVIACLAGTMIFGCGGTQQAATAPDTAPEAESEGAEDAAAGDTVEADDAVTEETVTEAAAADTTDPAAEEADEENYETGDASLDDPRNQDEIGENEILVVSFGTSYNDSRRETIGGIEQAIADAYPDWSVRRAFTSQIIIDHVKKRDGVDIDNVEAALKRASDNGVKQLVVQPTHLMSGFEYNDLVDELAGYSDAFESVAVGEPLLISDEAIEEVAKIVHDATVSYDDGKTAICFMGHGTEADSNEVYGKVQKAFDKLGYENYYIGTVEATPSLDDVIAAIDGKGYEKTVLRPLMVVAGDHANNDMAGDDDDSWKSVLTAKGYQVEPVIEGLGQLPEIQQIYVERVESAIGKLK